MKGREGEETREGNGGKGRGTEDMIFFVLICYNSMIRLNLRDRQYLSMTRVVADW